MSYTFILPLNYTCLHYVKYFWDLHSSQTVSSASANPCWGKQALASEQPLAHILEKEIPYRWWRLNDELIFFYFLFMRCIIIIIISSKSNVSAPFLLHVLIWNRIVVFQSDGFCYFLYLNVHWLCIFLLFLNDHELSIIWYFRLDGLRYYCKKSFWIDSLLRSVLVLLENAK